MPPPGKWAKTVVSGLPLHTPGMRIWHSWPCALRLILLDLDIFPAHFLFPPFDWNPHSPQSAIITLSLPMCFAHFFTPVKKPDIPLWALCMVASLHHSSLLSGHAICGKPGNRVAKCRVSVSNTGLYSLRSASVVDVLFMTASCIGRHILSLTVACDHGISISGFRTIRISSPAAFNSSASSRQYTSRAARCFPVLCLPVL